MVKKVWCKNKRTMVLFGPYTCTLEEFKKKVNKKYKNGYDRCDKCGKRFKLRFFDCETWNYETTPMSAYSNDHIGCWHSYIPAHKRIIRKRKTTKDICGRF